MCRQTITDNLTYISYAEESVREVCGVTLHAISQRSPDVLKRHAALALPLAFLAMHQKNDQSTCIDWLIWHNAKEPIQVRSCRCPWTVLLAGRQAFLFFPIF